MRNKKNLLVQFVLILPLLFATSIQSLAADKTGHKNGISSFSYHGWADSLLLNNGNVEAIIVPAVGRVMQFHFVGEDDVFWESSAMQGKPAEPTAKEWANFGGDKSWPSPQSDWQKMIGRGWPPPATFDSTPLEAHKKGTIIELVSPVDPQYGIRVHRNIKLDPRQPILTITTTYEKVSGDPVKVGVGVITQLRDPQRAFIKVPPQSKFPDGYVVLNFEKPLEAKVQDGLFSLTRSHENRSQIGSDGSSLLWMNEKYAVRIDSPRVPKAEYANQGSSSVIYTNADPDAYVELETYGPLTTMKVGDKIQRTNVYTLSRRTDGILTAKHKRFCTNRNLANLRLGRYCRDDERRYSMNYPWKFWLGIVLLPSLCLLAVGQGKGHGHGHNKHDDEDGYAYTKHDRDAAWHWYHEHENGLPPGLAKKDRLPPGLEKQLAIRGTLPPGLQKKMRPCPPELVHELPPPPPNCEHTVIGGHIVLVNRTTHVVVDIIHFE